MRIRFRSSPTSLTDSGVRVTSPSLTSDGDTTMSASRKVMSGRPHSAQTEDFSNTNSPATFQTMMNKIFQDLISEGVVCVYLDDILIFTETMEEHDWVTLLVLERLRQYKLYLRHDKCEFAQTKIEYLGLIISHGQAEMDPVKI